MCRAQYWKVQRPGGLATALAIRKLVAGLNQVGSGRGGSRAHHRDGAEGMGRQAADISSFLSRYSCI